MIAIDTETTGLSHIKDHIIGISACDGDNEIFCTPQEFKTRKSWCKEENHIIFHNAKFDIPMLQKEGLSFSKYHDTKIMTYLLDQGKPTGLKHLMRTILGWKDVQEFKDVNIQNWEELSLYGKKDARATYEVYKVLEHRLKATGRLWNLYAYVELPLTKVIMHMEQTGIRVNRTYLEETERIMATALLQLQRSLSEKYGYINLNSPKQVAEKLFGELNLNPVKKTRGKTNSTDVEVLESLSDTHEYVRLLLDYRKTQKALSTYIVPLQKHADKYDILRTHFNQTITASGRLSSSDPINLQNIPRDMVDKVFIPREGHVFIKVDYDKQEPRILAHLSQDPKLLEIFRSGKDLYVGVVQAIEECTEDEATKKRQLGKVVFLALSYGAAAKKVAKLTKMSEEEAQDLINRIKMAFPRLWGYREDVIRRARQVCYTETLLGRRRYYPEINSENIYKRWESEREAFNSVIQGSGADITKCALNHLYRNSYNVVMTVHDSIVVESDTDCSTVIKILVENVIKLSVPLPVKITVQR